MITKLYLSVTFEDTTKADYTTLMAHYPSASTEMDADGFLLFDGAMHVSQRW